MTRLSTTAAVAVLAVAVLASSVVPSAAFVPSSGGVRSAIATNGGFTARAAAAAVARPSSSSSTSTLSMRMFDNSDDIDGPDRLKSCIPYALPLVDGDHFGRYFYSHIPPLQVADEVLIAPVARLFDTVPFLSLGLFLILSLGTRAANLSRPIRFNAQQAILIDIALIFPELVGGAFRGQRMPVVLVESASNFVFYFYMTCILYSVVSNLRGKKPDGIPFISQAAEMAVGPF